MCWWGSNGTAAETGGNVRLYFGLGAVKEGKKEGQ